MDEGEWYKTWKIAKNLGLKDIRIKEMLMELIVPDKLVNNGKTKGKMCSLK